MQSTGSRLAISNYFLALWIVFRVLDTPVTLRWGMLCVGAIAVLETINTFVLRMRYSPRWHDPFEMFLVHVPNK